MKMVRVSAVAELKNDNGEVLQSIPVMFEMAMGDKESYNTVQACEDARDDAIDAMTEWMCEHLRISRVEWDWIGPQN